MDLHPALAYALDQMQIPGWKGGFTQLACDAGVSPSHLRRLFGGQFGCSPQAWYDRHRLATVKAKLVQGHDPLKRLAFESGFSSPAHLSAWFGRQTGMPPGQYRRKAMATQGV